MDYKRQLEKIGTELKHHTTNMPQLAKFGYLENPTWRQPLS